MYEKYEIGIKMCSGYSESCVFVICRFFGRISDNPNSHEDGTLKSIRDNVDGLSSML